jgi:hypothetical protein
MTAAASFLVENTGDLQSGDFYIKMSRDWSTGDDSGVIPPSLSGCSAIGSMRDIRIPTGFASDGCRWWIVCSGPSPVTTTRWTQRSNAKA